MSFDIFMGRREYEHRIGRDRAVKYPSNRDRCGAKYAVLRVTVSHRVRARQQRYETHENGKSCHCRER